MVTHQTRAMLSCTTCQCCLACCLIRRFVFCFFNINVVIPSKTSKNEASLFWLQCSILSCQKNSPRIKIHATQSCANPKSAVLYRGGGGAGIICSVCSPPRKIMCCKAQKCAIRGEGIDFVDRLWVGKYIANRKHLTMVGNPVKPPAQAIHTVRIRQRSVNIGD